MHQDVQEILITEEQIAVKVKELGEQITKDYAGEELIVVAILNGAMTITADLMRHIDGNVVLDSIIASSYGDGTESSGQVKISKDIKQNIEGRNVLLVDDVVDSGRTLKRLVEFLQTRNPKSLKTCAFLDKPSRRAVDYEADYVGYTIPDAFVVGYGLDYAEKYRHLPYVGVIKPEVVK